MRRFRVILAAATFATGALASPALAAETKPEEPVTATIEPAPVDKPYERPAVDVQISDVRYEGGNGDAVVDPGERLKIWVTLSNYGTKTAHDITAKLTVDNAKVTVVDGTASWADIASDGHAVASSPFVVDVADDAKRSEGCGLNGAEIRPIEGTDGSGASGTDGSGASGSGGSGTADDGVVSSDGTVSSDGSTWSDSGTAPGEPASKPGAEPAGGTSDPNAGTTEPAPMPPDLVPPDPAPDYSRAPQPEPAESPVAFEAKMVVAHDGTTSESSFGTQVFCIMETQRGGATGGGAVVDDKGAPAAAPLAVGERTAARDTSRRGAASLATVLLAAAAALVSRVVLMRRVTAKATR